MAFDPQLEPTWYIIKINPEPWAIGPVSVGRKNGGVFPIVGQNKQLASYQEAVREALSDGLLVDYEVKITFYFWRRLETYVAKRKVTKHQVDATNLQKGTEDALQGILIFNDRQVRDVRSVIWEQGENVDPMIAIKFEKWWGVDPDELPDTIWDEIKIADTPDTSNDNSWPPRG